MRILFIAHYFQPEPNFFFGLPFAEELARRGHSVQVLTGFPNYPGGKIFQGYRQRLWKKETMNGIPVVRVPLYPSHDRSAVRRIASYSSLSLSQAMLGPMLASRADIAYVLQGPATIGLPACVFRWLKRIPFVYHIQDLWPDSLSSTGMFSNRTGLRLIHRWCDFVYSQAASVTVISPGMKQRLLERGVPERKVQVVYNWCDETQLLQNRPDGQIAEKLGMKGKFNILFAGNIGAAQDLDTVVDAAAILHGELPDIQFLIVGEGVEKERLCAKVQKRSLSNVRFHPRLPVSEIGAVLKVADALLICLRDDPLFSITVPSKTQAYLAIGRPILAAISGDAADLVEKARAGITCAPGNAESLAEAARKLYQMGKTELEATGRRGAAYYAEHLSFARGVGHFLNLFEAAHTARGNKH